MSPDDHAVEVAPSGWRGVLDHQDRLVLDGDGMRVRLGRRSGSLDLDRLDRAEVWRASDGLRRYRLLDAGGNRLALLHDQAWRLPEGRLTPLLEGLGCRVSSVDPPEGEDALADQSVTGAHGTGVRGGWVAGCAVALALVAVAAPLGGDDPALEAVGDWLRAVTAALTVLLLVLVVAWWLPLARSLPRPARSGVTRPGGGSRRAWQERAGIGRVGDRVTAWDGWGRVAVWPAEGPLAPASVAASASTPSAVLLDAEDRPLARLPVAAWAGPGGSAEQLTRRVADACGLPLARRGAPAGGELFEDHEPPSLVLPVVGTLALAAPLLLALVAGLYAGRELHPRAILWVPAAVGIAVLLGRLSGVLVAHVAAARGSDEPAVSITGEGVLLTYPLWAGLGILALPLLLLRAVPVSAAGVWLVVLVLVAVLGLVLAVTRPAGLPYRTAVCVVPLACGPIALGLAGSLPSYLIAAALVVSALGLVVWLFGGRVRRR